MVATIASWFSALLSWFSRLFEWLLGILKDVFEFLTDLPVVILSGILDGVIYVLNGIPVPDFMTQYSLQTMFSALPSSVLWFVQFFGIPQGLAILGAGVAFRLTRKALTLGQW